MNPYTCPIQGDIARADAVGLWELCHDLNVVEFGVGASTVILSCCAARLDCFDTSAEWIEKTRARIPKHAKAPPTFTRFTEAQTFRSAMCFGWTGNLPTVSRSRCAILQKRATQ